MRTEIKQNKKSNKLSEYLFQTLLRLRIVAIRNKLEPNNLNLTFVRVVLCAQLLQKIQLITETTRVQKDEFSVNSAYNSIWDGFQIDFIYFQKNEALLSLILLIEILFFTAVFALLFDVHYKLKTLNSFYKYYHIIHHYIILLPLLNISFNLIISDKQNNIGLPIMLVIFGLLVELLFYFNNYKNFTIEMEGCYTNQITNSINLLFQFILSFIIQKKYSIMLAQLLFLFGSILFLIKRIYNYQYNSLYDISINIFFISYLLTVLFNQNWYLTMIIFIFLNNVAKSIRQYKLFSEITIKHDEINLYKYQIYGNQEFETEFGCMAKFFQRTYKKNIIEYENIIVKSKLSSDGMKILLNIFKYKQIQLYLNLIKADKSDFSYQQNINLEANLKKISKTCQNIVNSKLNVKQFIQSLQIEQHNFQELINFIEQKCLFYHMIQKELAIDQYLINFQQHLNKILSDMEKFQNYFENQYDIFNGKLKTSKHSDQISINIIIAYIYVFYGNPFQVRDLLKREVELLSYDKITNSKIEQNEVLLVQTSLFKFPNQIINKRNKRLQKILGESFEPKEFADLLPNFQKTLYNNFIEEFIEKGFDQQQTINVFLNEDGFLIECELQLFVSIINDDIILNTLVMLKTQPNHFTVFDPKGRILGITMDIFKFFTKKSQHVMVEKITIQDFITKGMIQYYVPSIQQYLVEMSNQLKQGHFLEQKYQSSLLLPITTTWQFPNNVVECFDFTSILGLTNEDSTSPSKLQKLVHTLTLSIFKSTHEFYQCDNISQQMNSSQWRIQNTVASQIRTAVDLSTQIKPIVVSASNGTETEFSGYLELVIMNFQKQQASYFILRFRQLEEIIIEYQNKEQKQHYLKSIKENRYDGFSSEYEIIQNCLSQKKLFTPLIYNIILVAMMIIVTTCSLLACYILNYNNMQEYQDDVNFSATPQAMTFNIGGPFILQWNLYCSEFGLYKMSPFLEDRREGALVLAFDYWKSVHEQFSLMLNEKRAELGYDNITITRYLKGYKEQEKVDLYEFYTIMREGLTRQFLNIDYKNLSTFDPSILKTDGLIRQNLLEILKLHDYLCDYVINLTEESFPIFQDKILTFCLLSAAVIVVLLFILGLVNFFLLRIQTKFVNLLQYLNPKLISDKVLSLQHMKQIGQENIKELKWLNAEVNKKQQEKEKEKQKEKEKEKQIDQKLNPLSKLQFYREPYLLLIIIISLIGVELILFIFGSKLIAQMYNSTYQNSLILTMHYLKLKTRLDSAVLVGELIKTEHLISNNTSIELINQTENIEFFFDNLNVLTNLSNHINDQLITTNAYNESFQQRLLEIYNDNMCQYYMEYLSACQPRSSTLEYYDSENYTSLIDNGIFGIVQDFSKMAVQEYNYEQIHKVYEYNEEHSKLFLNSPLHSHFFQQYFIDIEYCIFLCFLDVFAYTQNLSSDLSNLILIYLISSSIAFLFFTSYLAGYWIIKQNRRLRQLKLIVTLLPSSLIQTMSFNKLLFKLLAQMK